MAERLKLFVQKRTSLKAQITRLTELYHTYENYNMRFIMRYLNMLVTKQSILDAINAQNTDMLNGPVPLKIWLHLRHSHEIHLSYLKILG
ncbi:hypothetical protein ALC53_11318 [Atta colombica]|uniref:Uncharacterized protein n=1 Tax=Atta colombica TaxID=520822 RepID=A0A151I012_9HYME|nr:hypothetical protein ALC53_11318 [Atta colombica]